MLFYNTILKTIRVSTSYNSYFGLMRQMYKKILFLQNKGIFLTKNIVLSTLAKFETLPKYVKQQKKQCARKCTLLFLFITSYFLFVKIAKFFGGIYHCVESCFGFWPVTRFESTVGVYPQLLFWYYRNGFLHQVGHFFL